MEVFLLLKSKPAKIDIFCILLLLFSCFNCVSQNQILEPKVFKEQYKKSQNAIIIDLRTATFYNQGRLSKAVNISFENPDFDKAVAYISKETPLFLYCQNGLVSQNTSIFMTDMGYKNIILMKGGFENWVKTPLPYVGGGLKSEPLAYFSIADIENLNKKYPLLLLDFYATWCKPCKQQDPILKELNEKYPALKIIKIDADKNQTLASHFEVEEIPTLILFKKQKQFWRKSGLVKGKQLEAIL